MLAGTSAGASFESETFYKVMFSALRRLMSSLTQNSQVHWLKVIDLVGSRKVFVSGGFAYVASSQQSSLVLSEFSARLMKALEVCAPPG